jgi:C4-dicarboxylate-specific signal transduction histidine kinase
MNEAWALLISLVAVAIPASFFWARRQYRATQRRSMKAFHSLSEEIIAARTTLEIAEKLSAVLPRITRATGVRLYLYNEKLKSLESVPTESEPEPMVIHVEGDHGGLGYGAVICLKNRMLINVPDVRRSPFVKSWKEGLPRSAMLVPMLAQQDTLGLVEVSNANTLGYFPPEEQAAVQHLANQAAAAMKLQQQNAVREQLFRSEKLAATAQLISGVANDLKAPLESISQLSAKLSMRDDVAVIERELRQLAAESKRAAEIVSRLVSFARPEDSSAAPIDINARLGELVPFREPEWKEAGLRVQNRLSPEQATVVGSQVQLEQTLLNLLLYAEQSAAASKKKAISISSSSLGGRVLVEIGYSSDDTVDPFSESRTEAAKAMGLDVCQAIAHSHGGEIRFRMQPEFGCFELDLPLTVTPESRSTTGQRVLLRSMTLMLVDPDTAAQRRLIGLLAARGHRAIPVNAEEAADMAQRLKFDAVLWAVRPAGWKWSEFQERLRTSVPAFVLISDGYDAEFAASLAESGGFLLSRPIQEADLDRMLEAVDSRAGVAK